MTQQEPTDDVMSRIDPGWAKALAPVADRINELMAWVRDQQAHGVTVLPSYERILRAFSIPFESIHVLIVGQDPYPTPGHPIGLSFAVAPGVTPLPKSLVNIYRELQDDLHVPPPRTGDLTPWTHQGVMLLNRCLTVEAGKPNSHEGKGWEAITDQAIRALDARVGQEGRPVPLVAILWGRKAQQLAPLMPHAAIIASPHPSPLSASRGFFGSRPFSRANEDLERMGARPIDWSL
ncbi:uracil-DNA glycosylase [Bifidobacterium cuniculi]|nr:uracil-DNA glycosylase [Bifidobacterium cuniculi]